MTFTGYASVTDTPYTVADYMGEYSEVIRRGAFARTLAEGADVPFKLNHDGMTLARTGSGTMRLAEDSTGLHVEADLDPRQSVVRDLQIAMDRKDVDEMSFGFRVRQQEWSPDYTQRDITDLDLHKGDVSVVNFGANPATAGATMRSLDLIEALRALNPRADITRAVMRELGEAPEGADTPTEAALALFSARLRALNLSH
ncbi:HK97 family phage prohead protease [Kitasatospora sp. MAP12-44]|uniref:HK97 family phage prohead protease n=1 Tax=Kitasatospora sp. MAP12-9 TaxID=3035100 RepID=UPI00247421D7|nr:HK97 family phage prohead protease [Kitasatospora sp. MAP12-44]